MILGPQLLLVGAVATVGVLHTVVPDHWVPITLIARQRGWSSAQTARASLVAGTGHVLSTLLIASIVWVAGVVVATRFGRFVDTASSIALVAFGGWIAVSAWRGLHRRGGHGHSHAHDIPGLGRGDIHGPELQLIPTQHGGLKLSIHEADSPPRFRLTGSEADAVRLETRRSNGARQVFELARRAAYWESVEAIPEPHDFDVSIMVERNGRAESFQARFTEHNHGSGEGHSHNHGGEHDGEYEPQDDPLYAPLPGDAAVLIRHVHAHRHGRGPAHAHWHDHMPSSAHQLTDGFGALPPLHQHRHKLSARTALLVILGSSPMVEGIPAFFAAAKYGIGLIVVMALVFGISTIATYVLLCVYSAAGLQRVRLGAFERYGEVLSGTFIALVGVAFWIWPIL